MITHIDNYSKIVKDLKEEYPKLSDFERLLLAVQIERNQLIENGLNVSRNDENRTSLEAIAVALGYSN